jgi:transketolase
MREEMRAQMVSTVTDLMAQDQRVTVLLGNISTTQFAETFQRFPERIYDVGILEQSMLSTAAGLALEGLIPVVHTIAPFLVERSIEQVKDDFGYQRLGGNFISIGASYDYGASGMTHHAPGDVQVLSTVPGMEIIIPGTPGEFDRLFRQAYANAAPTYYRLSVQRNRDERAVRFGKAEVVQRGSQATVIAIGPALDRTLEAITDLDVTVLY